MSREALHDAALSWLGSGATARLMLDGQFRILWANDAARAALAPKGWLDGKDGVLAAAQNSGAAALPAEAARLGNSAVFVDSYSLADGSNVVAVMRLLSSAEGAERFYGLELRRRSDAESIRYTGYRAYFGITQAEDRVLQQLLKGDNVERCAANLELSIDTVRSHVRQLYTKMNVSSREALFHAVMPFRVT